MLISDSKSMGLFLAATIFLLHSLPSIAREEVLELLAPWEAEGKLYKIGPQKIQFVGSFEGIMYRETGTGELDAAIFVCPAMHERDEVTNEVKASGTCHIVTAKGNVFGRFSCEGVGQNCDGQFEVTAGTDALEGITGSGEMNVRTAVTATMRDASTGTVVKESAGLAIWRNLRINVPERSE